MSRAEQPPRPDPQVELKSPNDGHPLELEFVYGNRTGRINSGRMNPDQQNISFMIQMESAGPYLIVEVPEDSEAPLDEAVRQGIEQFDERIKKKSKLIPSHHEGEIKLY